MPGAAAASVSALPVWSTADEAYERAWAGLGQLFRASALWLVGLVAATAAISQLRWWQQETWEGGDWLIILIAALQAVVTMLVMASVGVAWHRLLLLGERIGGPYLRLDAVVRRYFGYLVLMWVPIFAWEIMTAYLAAMADGAGAGTEHSNTLQRLLSALAWPLRFMICARLCLALPACALERNDASLSHAWHTSRQDFWRLLAGGMLCSMPLFIAGMLLPEGDTLSTYTFWSCVLEVAYVLLGIVGVGFISVAFRHFHPDVGRAGGDSARVSP